MQTSSLDMGTTKSLMTLRLWTMNSVTLILFSMGTMYHCVYANFPAAQPRA